MTVLDMKVAALPADAQALYATMAARRKARGEGFGGPYLALLNHPELARRVEELGFFLKFEGSAAAHDLPVHRAHRRAFDRRSVRMARPHRACARRRPAGGRDRLHRHRAASSALQQPYALAHAILEKTMAWQVVPDELQARAAAEWGKQGLVEIVVLSGFYQMFAAINQGFDISEVSGR